MENKLKEFKSRRRREMLWSKPKIFFERLIERISTRNNLNFNNSDVKSPILEKTTSENYCVHDENEESRLSVTSDTSLTTQPYWPTRVFQILFFLLWVTVYLIAIELEFGFVYLVLSALFFIYFNTRTGPKKEGELSAYSVFNPDCEAIEGTLKAEHLEREFNLIQHK